uniref:Uncharacterized protein n=1 Tax=Timema bartmani TaxID=61472 RepID=A0A7R9F697_9NEOP|nr:unnamed protein product [Timema bartmani]
MRKESTGSRKEDNLNVLHQYQSKKINHYSKWSATPQTVPGASGVASPPAALTTTPLLEPCRPHTRKNRKDEQITSASAPQSYTNLVISEEGVLCPWYRARLAQRRAFMSLNSHVINRVPRLVHTCDDCNDGYYPDINDDRNKFLKLFTNFIMEMKDQLCNKQESSKDSHSFENGDKYMDGKHYPYLGEKNDAQTSTMLPLMNTKEGIDWQPTSSSISTHFVSTEAPNNDKLQTSPSLQSIQSTTNHTKDNSMDNVSLSSASQQSNDEMSDQSVLSSVLVQTSSDSLSSTEPTPASNTTEDEVEQQVLSSDSTQPSSDSLSSTEPTPASNTTEDEMVEQQVPSSASTQPSSSSSSSTEPTPASQQFNDEMSDQSVLSSVLVQPSSSSSSSTEPMPTSNTTENKMVDQQVLSSASTQPSSDSLSSTKPTPASNTTEDEMVEQPVLKSAPAQPSSDSLSSTEPTPTSLSNQKEFPNKAPRELSGTLKLFECDPQHSFYLLKYTTEQMRTYIFGATKFELLCGPLHN